MRKKKGEIKEISRRVMSHTSSGMACGPVSYTSIDAEIVVDDGGQRVYLHAEWVDEDVYAILFEAARESIYDINEKLNDCLDQGDMEAFDELLNEKGEIGEVDISKDERYAPFRKELETMVRREIVANGYEDCLDDEDDGDDEDVVAPVRAKKAATKKAKTKKAKTKKAKTKKAKTKKAKTKKSAAKQETRDKKTPTKKMTTKKKTKAKKTPMKKTPAKKAAVKKTPVRKATAKRK